MNARLDKWLEYWFRNFPRNLKTAFKSFENSEAFHHLTENEKISLLRAIYTAAVASSFNASSEEELTWVPHNLPSHYEELDKSVLSVLLETTSIVFSSESGDERSYRPVESLHEEYNEYLKNIAKIRQDTHAFAMLQKRPYDDYKKNNDIEAWLESKAELVKTWLKEAPMEEKWSQGKMSEKLASLRLKEIQKENRKKGGNAGYKLWSARHIGNSISRVPSIQAQIQDRKDYRKRAGW